MIEREPIIAKLVADALEGLNLDIEVINDDSISFIDNLGKDNIFYLDPMFPLKKNKNAKVKKDMQFLQNICESEDNAYELTKAAYEHGKVILKRPLNAKEFEGIKSHHSILGEKIRFDIFT